MKIGAQLYTVKAFAQNLEDFENTLKKVAEIGYKYVQVSGVCDYDPNWLKEKLEKYGLKCVLTHTKPATKLVEKPVEICKEHDIFNCRCVGVGSMPHLGEAAQFPNDKMFNDFIDKYYEVAKILKENGKYLMYHNHAAEFDKLENGKYIWDALIETFPADLMGFTLDTYWIQYGGKNPAKEIRRLAGRLPCVHFKDYKFIRGGEPAVQFAPVGSGNLDWDEIIDACKDAGVEYALVEQDNCFGADPFECLKSSFEFMKSKGLEVE